MRDHGRIVSAGGLGLHDHACWTYEDDDDYTAALVEFLDDGLRQRQRLLYLAGWPVDKLVGDLEPLGDAEALVAHGALVFGSADAPAGPAAGRDPGDLPAVIARATRQALADGYRGLRVAGEVTTVLRDPANWEAHARREGIADRYMATHPVTALCCYDRRRVEDRGITEVASLHPLVRAPAGLVPFRLWSSGTGLVLEGEVDYFSAGDLRRMLDLAPRVAGDVPLDLGGLEFVDHHGVLALADHARTLVRTGSRLVPIDAPPVVDRISGLLGIRF